MTLKSRLTKLESAPRSQKPGRGAGVEALRQKLQNVAARLRRTPVGTIGSNAAPIIYAALAFDGRADEQVIAKCHEFSSLPGAPGKLFQSILALGGGNHAD